MSIILVVDDHPLNRHFLATLLSYHGHQVNEASDGVEALESARQQRPDLIITDVVMPRMDGAALVKALRADSDLADVPVIFYTASYRLVESRAIAKAMGIEHVISKPSEPEQILSIVTTALGHGPGSPERTRRVPSFAAQSLAQARQYIEWLQLASIRMSTLIELSAELHSEPDPERLMSTANRAMKTIFAADFALIVVTGEGHVPQQWSGEASVDPNRLEELLRRVAPMVNSSARRAAGVSDPLVQAARVVMPELRSALFVPMSRGNDIYGWILLGKHDAGPFSSDDERLAIAAAAELRAARDNLISHRAQRQHAADLSKELFTSREDLAALVEASPVSIIAFDQDRKARAWNPAAERIFGWRANEVIGRLNPIVPEDLQDSYKALADQCLAGGTIAAVETQRVRKDGTRIDVSLSMAPLHDTAGRPRGFVSLLTDITERKLTDAELRSSRERLRALSARVLSIQEQERTHLARELHDDLGQLLAAIKIDVSRLVNDVSSSVTPPARVVEGILPLIDSTLNTVSRIVSELRPSRIEMGLAAAIEGKLAEFQRRTEIECEVSIRPETLQIRDDLAIAIFRILEEALTNVARHSGATRAEVRVRQQEHELLLEVRDDGRGIRDSERTAENAYGLIGMRERALILGGSVSMTGVEGRGTIVTARIPLQP